MSEKILACPFCGNEFTDVRDIYGSRCVRCLYCGATGPVSITESDAILLWNAADNALAAKDAEIARLDAALIQCEGALADTEEQRHEAVSKLSLAMIRETACNNRKDELEAEIEKLRESMEFFSENASNYLAERDEARKVAKRLYARQQEAIKHEMLKEALFPKAPWGATRTEPQISRVSATDKDTP